WFGCIAQKPNDSSGQPAPARRIADSKYLGATMRITMFLLTEIEESKLQKLWLEGQYHYLRVQAADIKLVAFWWKLNDFSKPAASYEGFICTLRWILPRHRPIIIFTLETLRHDVLLLLNDENIQQF
ncbi:hypothetical protein NPIL_598131, partial [Nephila pilipes]